MNLKKAILFIITPLLLAVTLIITLGLSNNNYAYECDHDYTVQNTHNVCNLCNDYNVSHTRIGTGQDREELDEKGFFIRFPDMAFPPMFRGGIAWKLLRSAVPENAGVDEVYEIAEHEFSGTAASESWSLFHGIITDYPRFIADEYENYAELDFEWAVSENEETLTVTYFGFGYPDKGSGEPVALYQEHVFDISSVSEGKITVVE